MMTILPLEWLASIIIFPAPTYPLVANYTQRPTISCIEALKILLFLCIVCLHMEMVISLIPLSASCHALEKYCNKIQHLDRPFLSYWLLYKGYHPVTNDAFQ